MTSRYRPTIPTSASWCGGTDVSFQKLGGSLRYLDLGPGEPRAMKSYTLGGRSVHAPDASSSLSKGTVRDMRPHSKRDNTNSSGKSQPFVIKKRLARPIED